MKSSIDALMKNLGPNAGLDSHVPTPLYYQLYSLLKKQIEDGTIGYGAQLPTEQELGEAFDLSRITVKRAMDELAAESLVERRRGRGTSVIYKYKPKAVKAPLVQMIESIETMSRHTLTKVLDLNYAVPPADIREEFGIGQSDSLHRLLRVRLSEDDKLPFAYYTSWTKAPEECFSKSLLKKNTRVELMRKKGIELSRIDQRLSAEEASEDVAAELNLDVGAALLVVERRSYDVDENLTDVLRSQYNPKIFQYQMSMTLDSERYA